jgi:hypothetical protein
MKASGVTAAWHPLFNRIADGVQSEGDEQQLLDLLGRSPEARREFREFMALHSALQWDYAALAPHAMPPKEATRASTRPRWLVASFTSGVLVAAAAAVLLFTNFIAAIQPRRIPADRTAAVEPLATVTNTRFLLPEDPESPPSIGQSLAAGRVAILGGAAEMTLRNGVVIVLEGPGEMDLHGELAAFLHAGSVVVRMPEGMSGFRLDTATTGVLDLGTEFAVKAAPGFVTDVQVFDGAVVASSKSAGDTALFPTRLEAGQAARFSPQGSGDPEPIPYAENRFVRRLPPDVGIPVHVNPALGREVELRVYGRPRIDSIVVSRAREPVTIDGRLDDWRQAPGFAASRDGTDACPEWVDGRMMYDDKHLYIAAHVGDPAPMRSSIDPAVDPDLGWRGGSVQVRVSTDREMGWPAAGNSAGYYRQRGIVPTAEQKAAADNAKLSHLTMWFHAASRTPCLTIHRGMLFSELEVNPSDFQGAFTRDPDGKGYILEYAIPWRLLNCADDPPRAGDVLAAAWQVYWSDELGRLQRQHMVEIRNSLEPREINVWERGATWGRAEYR